MGEDVRPAIADDLSSGEVDLTCTVEEPFFSDWSRKGFLDVGLSGAVLGILPNAGLTGEGRMLAGDTARFRNGLFDGRLAVSPGEICLPESVDVDKKSAHGRREVWAGQRFKRAIA